MAKDLAVSNSTTNLPTQTPPNMERAIRVLSSQLFAVGLGHELPATGAPTAEQREGLERRAARIRQWLAPGGNEQLIRDEVGTLLGTMASRSGSEVDAEILLKVYVADLKDLPFFAVSAACRDYRQGKAGDKHWAPTQAEIRDVAQRYMAPLAKEGRSIDAILNAKVVDTRENPERRADVVRKVRESLHVFADAGRAAEELRMGRKLAEANHRKAESAEETDARLKSPMPLLSEEARRKFGPATVQEAAE